MVLVTTGLAFNVIGITVDAVLQPLFDIAVAEKSPAVFTVISVVVAPVLHKTVASDEGVALSVTLSCAHIFVAPEADIDIVGTGRELTIIVAGAEAHKLTSVAVTV